MNMNFLVQNRVRFKFGVGEARFVGTTVEKTRLRKVLGCQKKEIGILVDVAMRGKDADFVSRF